MRAKAQNCSTSEGRDVLNVFVLPPHMLSYAVRQVAAAPWGCGEGNRMRYPRWTSRGVLGAAGLVLGLILSGCGTTSTSSAFSTPTQAANSSKTPATISEASGCHPDGYSSARFVQMGALKVSVPQLAVHDAYAIISSTVPNKPYQLTANEMDGHSKPTPLVNPELVVTGGYALQLCNPTSTPHVLTNLSGQSDSSQRAVAPSEYAMTATPGTTRLPRARLAAVPLTTAQTALWPVTTWWPHSRVTALALRLRLSTLAQNPVSRWWAQACLYASIQAIPSRWM